MSSVSNNNDTSIPRVIIADDDPSLLLLLKHILNTEGYCVYEANNGKQVIDLCKQKQFDLAILDVVMPELNGIDACRILNNEIDDTLPVLLITSLDDDITIEQAFNSGASEYITKPINWSVFKHRTKRLIEAKKSKSIIKKLEYHDTLTGLPNRTLLLDRLESAIIRAQRNDTFVAFIMIDIDNFKLINESLGHAKGDALLKSIAALLHSTVRESDTLSRTSGDEFCIIIEEIYQVEDIGIIVENLSSTLEHDIILVDQTVHIKASMGIALYPQDGNEIDSLLRNADIALYRAKDLGKNLYQFFSPDLSKQVVHRLTIENSLRGAIDKQELILYYQPKIELNSFKPNAMEALVRWQHPTQGLIPPDEFIPIAEETGLIIPLGEWVIQTACKQFCEWQANGLDINNISINVSARQFKEQDLVSIFDKLISQSNINPSSIELELTESVLLINEHHIESKLNTLHNMGILISIDDFGTGYASLSYLKRLPIDILKIDRSFTDGILQDPDDIAIVHAISGLAKALDLKLVAEGIETKAQLDKLLELDIDYGQGFYWSPPRAAEDYPEMLNGLAPG